MLAHADFQQGQGLLQLALLGQAHAFDQRQHRMLGLCGTHPVQVEVGRVWCPGLLGQQAAHVFIGLADGQHQRPGGGMGRVAGELLLGQIEGGDGRARAGVEHALQRQIGGLLHAAGLYQPAQRQGAEGIRVVIGQADAALGRQLQRSVQLPGLGTGLRLQAGDLDLAVGLHRLGGRGTLQLCQLVLAIHEQGRQAVRGQRQDMFRQRHPAVKVHMLVCGGIAQGVDGALHQGRHLGVAPRLVPVVGCAHQQQGVEVGGIFGQLRVAALLRALQRERVGHGLPRVQLVGEPVPALPIPVVVTVAKARVDRLGRRGQQGAGGVGVKPHAAVNVAEVEPDGRFRAGGAFCGQHALAVLLQCRVGRGGLLQL